MPNTSISGLVSGLDTSTIISQLMQLEARPQNLLKTKMSTEQKVVTALQGINAKLAGIATKAADLAKASAWSPLRAASSNDKVTVTADATVEPRAIDLKVVSRASASVAVYSNAMAPSGSATSASSLTVSYNPTSGRTPATIAVTDGSLQGIADAINKDTDAGLKATLVRAGGADTSPVFKLQVTSAATGEFTDFTIDDGSGNFLGGVSSVPGKNAEVEVDGVTHSYSSNTITDLMPGVDVTLLAGSENTSATITVERDVASLSDKVKAMVDAVNAAVDEIGTLTAYDATTKKAGVLAGDSTARGVRDQLIESVTRGVGAESLATVGIQVDRYGKLTFDEAKFERAYAADPARTVARFAGTDQNPVTAKDPYDASYGWADRLHVLGKAFSDSVEGTLTGAIKSRQSAIKGMEDDIADWDTRLAARQTTLQRQYTALETALGKLQSQSSWLAGQIGSLPSMSNGQ